MVHHNPPRVLEMNLISAQDLALVNKSMKTYAVAWVDPERKLTTRIDQVGLNSPTWNEKFMFRVDDKFLYDESSSIMIEIYAPAWLKDALVGSVRVTMRSLFGSLYHNSSSTRYVALQVRRPSGRPQGIVNMGVTLLDSTMRSMPLFPEFGPPRSNLSVDDSHVDPKGGLLASKENSINKARTLRRTQSDKTDFTATELSAADEYIGKPLGSVYDPSSICNGSAVVDNQNITKEGSLVNGGGSSIVNGGSLVNGTGSSVCYSDVGPSASVVAAAIAKGLYITPQPPTMTKRVILMGNEGDSTVMDERWAEAKESEEALKARLEMWRNELPPIYDTSKQKANGKQAGRARRRADGGGLFSCFAFGCEISISCGGGNKNRNGTSKDSRSCL